MAELQNDSGALRFALTLVAREAPSTGGPPGEEGPPGRLLAAAGLEYLDRRDGEWWPLLRLPPLHLPGAAVEGLLANLEATVAGGAGFAWRPGAEAAFAVQAELVRFADALRRELEVVVGQ